MNIRESEKTIINAINSTGLPLDILEYILRDILNTIHSQVDAMYAQAEMEKLQSKQEKPKAKSKVKGGEANES